MNILFSGFTSGNVLSSIIAAIIIFICCHVAKYCLYLFTWRRPFAHFFGKDMLDKNENACVVLDTYMLDRQRLETAAKASGDLELATFPYKKQFPDGTGWSFTGAWQDVLGYCTCRALLYLNKAIAPLRKTIVPFQCDEKVWGLWGPSLICVGGPAANSKSKKILDLPENKWYGIGKSPESNKRGIYLKSIGNVIEDEPSRRYGLILKLRHPDDPNHSLIVCTGNGEWGTSGACWYLSEKWRKLYHKFGTKSFALLLEVDPECDASAREVEFMTIFSRQSLQENYEAISTSVGKPHRQK